MIEISIKPLSVNEVWRGRRFKTDKYKFYELEVMYLLPKFKVPEGKVSLTIKVGYSSKLADIDNMAKPFIDILQKKYQFNDRDIYELHLYKEIVAKRKEYIRFNICSA